MLMPTLFRVPADQHFIDAGRVFCPARRHDIDFDECAGCAFVSEIELDAKPAFVRCRPPRLPVWPSLA